MGQPPVRWTSLEKKTSAKPSMVFKRLNVTWASGLALFFSAVTSVSACNRIALEREESRAWKIG